ncbi:beta-aspartyl-peptidase [bacterium]|nr:beta-aspartyl-peptidase [bacterium]
MLKNQRTKNREPIQYLLLNAEVLSPEPMGLCDVWVASGKVVGLRPAGQDRPSTVPALDLQGQKLVPGFIDQHIHLIGAGGKSGFSSMTPEIPLEDLVRCGTTTAVGLLGTDGSTRSIKSLYAKVKALEEEGMSAYMYTGYYGLEPTHITGNLQDDMIFIDKVLGCKVAIADIRSSYPTDLELLRLLRNVMVAGRIARKKGILHLHLGALKTSLDPLFRLVEEHEFPIEHISPTHVARSQTLFEHSIEFAKLGGMIDITTGASKYTEPWKAVVYALDQGVDLHKMTFSTDGYAGLDARDAGGNVIGTRPAPIEANREQAFLLHTQGGLPLSEALKLITLNPATNVGLPHKGRIAVGADADFVLLSDTLDIAQVYCKGMSMLAEADLPQPHSPRA